MDSRMAQIRQLLLHGSFPVILCTLRGQGPSRGRMTLTIVVFPANAGTCPQQWSSFTGVSISARACLDII